tara:strand:- start:51044 stop:52222 length:1179 start_codon:yes stop_codon:yes gene_type:complete
MQSNAKYLSLFFISFFVLPINGEFIGEVNLDNRHYFNQGIFGQDKNHSSISFSPEIFKNLEDDQIFHFKAKLRKDTKDRERNLVDIQELNFIEIGKSKEIKYGISKEFWGVTETSHRVDIINQTDTTESFDGEDKLGQPMVKVSFEKNWGNIDLYALLGFRERTYSGDKGRLRLPLVIDTDNAVYESSAKNKRMDFAIRWSHYFNEFEVALSHFSGTSREPRLLPSTKKINHLTPYYEKINQTGLETLYLIGGLALKLEAISRSGQGDTFSAATAGFEYTQVGIADSRIDLGWILEANHDDRLTSSPFVVGTRLTFNDSFDSKILSGIFINEKTEELGVLIEASRRIASCCMISLEAMYFDYTNEDNREIKLFESFKEDDFLRLEFMYYFGK